MRWSRFKETCAGDGCSRRCATRVFPFIKSIGPQRGSSVPRDAPPTPITCSDALFMMPTARVLANVVDQLDAIDMADTRHQG